MTSSGLTRIAATVLGVPLVVAVDGGCRSFGPGPLRRGRVGSDYLCFLVILGAALRYLLDRWRIG